MRAELQELCNLVRGNPASFKRFSDDLEQVDPSRRVESIAGIAERLEVPAGSRGVDLGTGYGYGAVLLNALGYTVIGIERNRDKLEDGLAYWGRLRVPFKYVSDHFFSSVSEGDLCFTHRDIRNLSNVADASLDWATAFYISSYMFSERAFDEVGRILRPNGSFVISTEGPRQFSPFLRKLVSSVGERMLRPRGFTLAQTLDFGARVHDRYVFVYKKVA